MKSIFIALLFTILSKFSFTQNQVNETHFFGQCLLTINDETLFNQLQEELKKNPYVYLVRLDWNTKRVFILTKDVSVFTENDLKSWFGPYGDALKCIQTGVHGVDVVNQFPFTECN